MCPCPCDFTPCVGLAWGHSVPGSPSQATHRSSGGLRGADYAHFLPPRAPHQSAWLAGDRQWCLPKNPTAGSGLCEASLCARYLLRSALRPPLHMRTQGVWWNPAQHPCCGPEHGSAASACGAELAGAAWASLAWVSPEDLNSVCVAHPGSDLLSTCSVVGSGLFPERMTHQDCIMNAVCVHMHVHACVCACVCVHAQV